MALHPNSLLYKYKVFKLEAVSQIESRVLKRMFERKREREREREREELENREN
jgi:hypothetical protein